MESNSVQLAELAGPSQPYATALPAKPAVAGRRGTPADRRPGDDDRRADRVRAGPR